MATYKTEYEAIMDGMRGAELRDFEVMSDYMGQANCVSLVDAMHSLNHMVRDETLYIIANIATGLNVMTDEQAALNLAREIHADNMPTAYEVRRNTRGYAVRLIYSND